MSLWKVEFEIEAVNDLNRLSPPIHRGILIKLEWLRQNFDSITPQPLGGAWRGFYKLRVNDYRVIYDIKWDSFTLIVVIIGHRSSIYKRKNKPKS